MKYPPLTAYHVKLALKRKGEAVGFVDVVLMAESKNDAIELVRRAEIHSANKAISPGDPKPGGVVAEVLIGIGASKGAVRMTYSFPPIVTEDVTGRRCYTDHVDAFFRPEHIPGMIKLLESTLAQLTATKPEGT